MKSPKLLQFICHIKRLKKIVSYSSDTATLYAKIP